MTRLRQLVASRGLEAAALFTVATSILTAIIIARTLGPTGRGQVVILATWGQALAWICGLSIDKALIARNTDGERQTSIPIGAGLSLLMVVGGTATAITALITAALYQNLLMPCALAVVLLGTIACDAKAAQLLVAERWRSFALLRFMQPAVYLIGCSLSAAWVKSQDAAFDFIVLALCLSVVGPALLVGGRLKLQIRGRYNIDFRELASFAGGYHVGSVLSFLSTRIDVMAVSLLFGLREVGLYAVASSVGQLAMVFGSASLIRGITGKSGSSGIDRLGLIAVSTMTGLIVIGAPLLVVAAYGEPFAPAASPARYLCLAGLMLYIRQGMNGWLAGAGKSWDTAIANGAGVAVFVAFVALADSMEALAVLTTLSAAVSTGTAYLLVHRLAPRAEAQKGVQRLTRREPSMASLDKE